MQKSVQKACSAITKSMEKAADKAVSDAADGVRQIGDELDGAKRELSGVRAELEKLSQEMGRTSRSNPVAGAADGADSFRGTLGKLGGVIATAFAVDKVTTWADETQQAYITQVSQERKLITIMNQRLKATQDEYQSIMDLTAAQQGLGIIGDEVQLAGAQQLATFATEADTLKTLIPAMNNLLAQQSGYSASTSDAVAKANMMGKVLLGEVGALKEVGITFSAAEERVLRYGTESERAAMLAQVITANVGSMNQALASTDYGRQIQLANAIGDIKEQFGAVVNQIKTLFLPLMQATAQVMAVVASYARQFVQALANLFGGGKKQDSTAADTANKIAISAGNAAGAEDKLTQSIKDAGKAAKNALASFDDLNVLQQDTADTEITTPDYSGTAGTGTIVWDDEIEVNPAVAAALEKLKELLEPLAEIDLNPLKEGLTNLKNALVPLTRSIFSGLEWAYKNLFVPLAEWTVEDFLPAFLRAMASGLRAINRVISAVAPYLVQLWDNFLSKVASFVGGVLVGFLNDLGRALENIGDFAETNPEAFTIIATGLTSIVGAIKLSGWAKSAAGIAALGASLNWLLGILAVVTVTEIIAHWDDICAAVDAVVEKLKNLRKTTEAEIQALKASDTDIVSDEEQKGVAQLLGELGEEGWKAFEKGLFEAMNKGSDRAEQADGIAEYLDNWVKSFGESGKESAQSFAKALKNAIYGYSAKASESYDGTEWNEEGITSVLESLKQNFLSVAAEAGTLKEAIDATGGEREASVTLATGDVVTTAETTQTSIDALEGERPASVTLNTGTAVDEAGKVAESLKAIPDEKYTDIRVDTSAAYAAITSFVAWAREALSQLFTGNKTAWLDTDIPEETRDSMEAAIKNTLDGQAALENLQKRLVDTGESAELTGNQIANLYRTFVAGEDLSGKIDELYNSVQTSAASAGQEAEMATKQVGFLAEAVETVKKLSPVKVGYADDGPLPEAGNSVPTLDFQSYKVDELFGQAVSLKEDVESASEFIEGVLVKMSDMFTAIKNDSAAAWTSLKSDADTGIAGLNDAWLSYAVTVGGLVALCATARPEAAAMWLQMSTDAQTAVTSIETAWAPVQEWFQATVVTPVSTMFASFWTACQKASKGTLDAIKKAWQAVPTWAADNVNLPLATGFAGLCSSVRSIFDETWENMTTALTEHLNAWLGALESFLNTFASGVNEIISTLNELNVDAMGVHLGISISPIQHIELPRLAQGAVIPANREFLAVLGDQRNGRNLEAPESLIRQIVREESAGQDVTIRFTGNLAQLARVLHPAVETENRRRGRNLISGGTVW